MYVSDYVNKTIKEAQIEILKIVLNDGETIEDTLELNNISICIKSPLRDTYDLFDNLTPIAKKHMEQMMLEPDPNLPKTHYERLHNYVVGDKIICEIGENLVSYDQIEEVIKRLKENPLSKRCILTLWSPEDINDKYALSWTFAQLLIRNNKLIMTSFFRSLDIWNGFPYNCVGIANLQADIADRIGVETGEFIIHIGSAHTYKKHINEIKEYLAKT